MKRFLLWILGVVLGVAFFLAAIMGVSWWLTGTSDLPETGGAAFAGVALEENGYLWQVPLVGAVADKVFYAAPTLTTQRLGEVGDAHPAFTLPDWATDAQLEITDTETGQTVFSGDLAAYAGFYYPAAGTYTVTARVWRLPEGMAAADLAGSRDRVARNPGLEQPARPVGWYEYRFQFVLHPVPSVTLSSDTIRQGGTVCLVVRGMLGSDTPTAETDLGTVVFQAEEGGWRGYLGAAYNAEAGAHTITVTAGGQSTQTTLTVTGRSYGRTEVTPTQDSAEANEEFRQKIWSLYTAASGAQQWAGPWQCPVDYMDIILDYGAIKTVNGKAAGQSNSIEFAAKAGTDVVAPASGTVVFSGTLLLTGETVVIDHGCGVRTYLYGLASRSVSKGDTVIRNGAVGTAGERVTVDVKIGSKSVCPWDLFQGQGGLFYLG